MLKPQTFPNFILAAIAVSELIIAVRNNHEQHTGRQFVDMLYEVVNEQYDPIHPSQVRLFSHLLITDPRMEALPPCNTKDKAYYTVLLALSGVVAMYAKKLHLQPRILEPTT